MSGDDPREDLDALLGKMKSASSPFRETLQELHRSLRDEMGGRVADYIPELAKADPSRFGISVVTCDGLSFRVGDWEALFSIQSISKPFVFGMALEDHGREEVLAKVNVEPTGEAFNAIVLDEGTNRPFNPMVNSGAIATADLIEGADYPDRVGRLLAMFGRYFGRDAYVDNSTFFSERLTGHRNRAIAYLMLNFGMIRDRVPETLELYFQQCSVLVNSHDLAVMGATLANGGVNPHDGRPRAGRALRQGPARDHALVRDVRLRRGVGLPRGAAGQERGLGRDRRGDPGRGRDRHLLPSPGRQGQQRPRGGRLPRVVRAVRPARLRGRIYRPPPRGRASAPPPRHLIGAGATLPRARHRTCFAPWGRGRPPHGKGRGPHAPGGRPWGAGRGLGDRLR